MTIETDAITKMTVVLNRIAGSLEKIADELPQLTSRMGEGFPSETEMQRRESDEPTRPQPNPEALPPLGHGISKEETAAAIRERFQMSPGLPQRPPIR